MPANRRRHAITAHYERWVLLGSRLELRRRALGYTWRTDFENARGINKRLAADIEKAPKDRVNRYMPGTMQLIAQGYAVTYESVEALLRGETDDLVPAAATAPSATLPPAPASELLREDTVRPYATPIWERLLELAGRGVLDPTGAQLGLGPDDAKVWDGSAGAMSLADRAWLVGDIRRRREARAAERDATSA